MKCPVCNKEITSLRSSKKFCCEAHRRMNNERYVGESIADAIKRKMDKKKRLQVNKNKV